MGKKKATLEASGEDRAVDLYSGDELKNVRYGRWNDNPKGRYLVPGYLSGSDYSGSLVQKSNYKAFIDAFEDGDDVWWTSAPGGHGTYAIVIDMQGIPEDKEEEVAEFVNALSDYPLADEELHSEMESEAQDEAWRSWAERDFAKALQKKFSDDETLEAALDDVLTDDEKLLKLRELFQDASEKANEYWVNEEGDSMYINIDRIVKKVTAEDVTYFIIDKGIR